jgi:hypothetical protein
VAGFQSRIVLSHPTLARSCPSGLHTIPDTIQRWPRNALGNLSAATSQSVTSISVPTLANRFPSGLHATS